MLWNWLTYKFIWSEIVFPWFLWHAQRNRWIPERRIIVTHFFIFCHGGSFHLFSAHFVSFAPPFFAFSHCLFACMRFHQSILFYFESTDTSIYNNKSFICAWNLWIHHRISEIEPIFCTRPLTVLKQWNQLSQFRSHTINSFSLFDAAK